MQTTACTQNLPPFSICFMTSFPFKLSLIFLQSVQQNTRDLQSVDLVYDTIYEVQKSSPSKFGTQSWLSFTALYEVSLLSYFELKAKFLAISLHSSTPSQAPAYFAHQPNSCTDGAYGPTDDSHHHQATHCQRVQQTNCLCRCNGERGIDAQRKVSFYGILYQNCSPHG